MNKYQDIDYTLAKLLLNRVQVKKGTISYGDCAKELSSKLGRDVNAHFNLTVPLRHVCDMCFESGVPFLTAFVVYKNDIHGAKTGQGFYTIACEYRPEYKTLNPVDAWKAELSKVRKCGDWSPLSAYLEKCS